MRTRSRKVLIISLFAVAAAAALGFWWMRPETNKPVDPRMACHVAAYRLDDGRLIDIAPLSKNGAAKFMPSSPAITASVPISTV